jgi:hypothetical protein
MIFQKMISSKIFACLCGAALITSCSSDFVDSNNLTNDSKPIFNNSSSKEELMNNFSAILSRVLTEKQSVRKFLKDEALLQFDKNYDVLYQNVKDKSIDGKSLREMLVEASSERKIREIEEALPLLNIYVSNIPFADVTPENLDVTSQDIPVVVERNDSNAFYLKGKNVETWVKGEIPDFHAFVVNENTRMMVDKAATRASGKPVIKFRSPNFDGLANSKNKVKVSEFFRFGKGKKDKLVEAYDYFHGTNGGIDQKGFQRDYLYYGITPSDTVGQLNYSTTEYIRTIEIDPKALNFIADEIEDKEHRTKLDPVVKSRWEKEYGRFLNERELIDRFWTVGTYDLKFTIISSKSTTPTVVVVPLRPEDLWDFHINLKHRHGNIFHRHKNIYTLDPKDFTSKVVNLTSYNITFGKWDLSTEALQRFVRIEELDSGSEVEVSSEYDMERFTEKVVKGGTKFGVGFGKNSHNSFDVSSDFSSTDRKTDKYKHAVKIRYIQESDLLGIIPIYYYDPIIEYISGYKINGSTKFHEYGTGSVKFTINIK